MKTMTVLVVVLPLILAADLGAQTWWDPAWDYRIPITLSHTLPNVVSDYTVHLVVTPVPGMSSSYSDVRFVASGGQVLPHWLEYSSPAGAMIRVRVTQILPGAGSTIWLYYANPSAAATSNIKQAFLVGDDFNGAAVDPAIWESSGMMPVLSGGQLHLATTSGGYFRSLWQADFDSGDTWEFRFYGRKTGAGGADYTLAGFRLDGVEGTSGDPWIYCTNHAMAGPNYWWASDGRAVSSPCGSHGMTIVGTNPPACAIGYLLPFAIDGQFLWRTFRVNSTSATIAIEDSVGGQVVTAESGQVTTPAGEKRPVAWCDGSGGGNPSPSTWDIEIAWVRKVITPEPIWVFGSSQELFFHPHGLGCAGSGASVPVLGGQGDPSAGGSVSLAVSGALPNRFGLLFGGVAPAGAGAGCGCFVNIQPLIGLFSFATDSAGSWAQSFGIPPSMPVGTVHLQGFVYDPGSPCRFQNTNGLRIN